LQTYQPYLQQIGQALLDSLWQFALLYVLYHAATRFTAKLLKPSGHYLLLTGLTFSGTAVFLFNIITAFSSAPAPYSIAAVPTAHSNSWLQWPVLAAGIVYIAALVMRLTILLVRFFKKPAARYLPPPPVASQFMPYLQELCAWLQMRLPAIRFSNTHFSPYTTGLLRTFIVLPVSLINQLTEQETEAILLHELAHLKRKDHWVNLLVVLAEQVLFFNPFARLLITKLKQQREMACDDWVLQQGIKPMYYANALHKTAQFQQQQWAMQLAFAGQKGDLLYRIQRLFGKTAVTRNTSVRPLQVLALLLPLLIAVATPRLPMQKSYYDNTALPYMGVAAVDMAEQLRHAPSMFTGFFEFDGSEDGKSARLIKNKPLFMPAPTVTPAPRKLLTTKAPATTKPRPVVEESGAIFMPVSDASPAEAFTTYVSSDQYQNRDVVLKFSDSALVYESFIQQHHLQQATDAALKQLLSTISTMSEALTSQPEPIVLTAPIASITVTQEGHPNLYFNNTLLEQVARYQPASGQWKIRFLLRNGDRQLGERYVTITERKILRSVKL
jgi:beta-lactamase regulating signal transducer with metallopeptidase domain